MWQLILGPVLGTFGGIIQKYLESKEKAAERKHELDIMDKEAELADRRLKIEQEIKREQADAAAFSASYNFVNDRLLPDGGKLSKGQVWIALLVDALSRLIRPVATIWYQLALAGVFCWAAYELNRINAGLLDPTEMQAIVHEIIFSIIGTAETILLWWFGIRGMSKRGK